MIKIQAKDWILENIDTVLFDKDGTIIDLHYFWGKMTELRALEVIKRYNLVKDFLSELCEFLGYDINSGKMLSDGITALYSRVKIIEIFREKLEIIGVFTSEEEITDIFDNVSEDFYKDIEKYLKPIDEAVQFIFDLHKLGVKIGIVTSDSVVSTNLMIKKFNWESLFSVVVGREDSIMTKESGALTKIALEKLNALPARTLMIGDAPMDSISAKNAGVEKTILVSTGQLSFKELEKHSAYVVNSLKELKCFKI